VFDDLRAETHADTAGRAMTLSLRRGNASDAAAVGDICYRAFKAIADQHNFLPDFPNPDSAIGLLTLLIGHPNSLTRSPNSTARSPAATSWTSAIRSPVWDRSRSIQHYKTSVSAAP